MTHEVNVCKHNEFCGGCLYQGVPYTDQIAVKGKEVKKLFDTHEIAYESFLGIEGSPCQYGYRSKMEYTFGDMVKDGEMTLGMHQKKRFMSIVTVDDCQLVDRDFNVILSAVLEFCNEKGYAFYHKKSHIGLLRNLIIRKGERTCELLVNIVTSSQGEFHDEKFVELIRGLQLGNQVVGILRTINDSVADFVYCESLKTLWGRDYYKEHIMGLEFNVSAFSFFQTNVEAVEKLYTEAISLIPDFEGKTVYDLYCGTGTITQVLARIAKEAIGIELVEDAVLAARENAMLNGLANCRFLSGDVLEVLDEVEEKPDIIVMDPPRVGIHPKTLDKIIRYGVKHILYISCNPKTLVQNLQVMESCGYQVKTVKAFDNFPFTKHIECVVLLEKF